MSPKRKPPWYQQLEWIEQADRCLDAWQSLPSDAPQRAQMRAFAMMSAVSLVFESNRMEGAGLSEGETRRVIDALEIELPTRIGEFSRESLSQMSINVDAVLALLGREPSLAPYVQMRFGGHARGVREVRNHIVAYTQLLQWAQVFREARHHAHNPAARSALIERGIDPDELPLLSESFLQQIHRQLADGLEQPEHLVARASTASTTAWPAPAPCSWRPS